MARSKAQLFKPLLGRGSYNRVAIIAGFSALSSLSNLSVSKPYAARYSSLFPGWGNTFNKKRERF